MPWLKGVLAQRARGDVPDRASLARCWRAAARPSRMAGQEHHVGARCLRRKDAEFVNTEAHDATRPLHELLGWQEGKPQQSVMTD